MVRGDEAALEKERDEVGASEIVGNGDLADLGIDGTGLEVEGLRSELDKYRSADAGVTNGLTLSGVLLIAGEHVGLGDLVIGK